jgi:hypothetical protein
MSTSPIGILDITAAPVCVSIHDVLWDMSRSRESVYVRWISLVILPQTLNPVRIYRPKDKSFCGWIGESVRLFIHENAQYV